MKTIEQLKEEMETAKVIYLPANAARAARESENQTKQ